MSYEKYYANGWADGESGATPITAGALNHIENGISDLNENPLAKWKRVTYTTSELSSGHTDVTTDSVFPTLAGYTRAIFVQGTNSAYTGVTGTYIDSSDYVHLRCRNFSTESSTPMVTFFLVYLKSTYTWS